MLVPILLIALIFAVVVIGLLVVNNFSSHYVPPHGRNSVIGDYHNGYPPHLGSGLAKEYIRRIFIKEEARAFIFAFGLAIGIALLAAFSSENRDKNTVSSESDLPAYVINEDM